MTTNKIPEDRRDRHQILYVASSPGGDPNHLFAQEKLAMAVYALATGEGKIKERLFGAYSELSPVQEADLPERLREEFRWIKETLTKNPAKTVRGVRNGKIVEESTGCLGATVPYMRIKKAVEVASRICNLEWRLEDLVRIRRNENTR